MHTPEQTIGKLTLTRPRGSTTMGRQSLAPEAAWMRDRGVDRTLIALAIAVRAAAVLVLSSHEIPRSTYEHGEIAANLLAGRGFTVRFLGTEGPTSQQAPVYPMLVAAAYALGGSGTPRALLILELGQAVLGGALVAGVLALARELTERKRVACVAGLIAAVYPTLVYAATHVQVALLAATLLVWVLAWAYRAGRTRRTRDAAATGALLALLVLTDPILGLVAPGALGALCRARTAAAMLLALTLGIAPWMARNLWVHGEPVWIKSTFGYAFWQGNCALSEGTDKVVRASVERALEPRGPGLAAINRALWNARHEAGSIDDIALTPADLAELRRLSEPARSRRLFQRALHELRAEPGRYAQLCLRRLRYFVLFDETNPKSRNRVYRASHLSLTALGILGLVRARPDLRRRLLPTVLTALLITAFHSLTIVSAGSTSRSSRCSDCGRPADRSVRRAAQPSRDCLISGRRTPPWSRPPIGSPPSNPLPHDRLCRESKLVCKLVHDLLEDVCSSPWLSPRSPLRPRARSGSVPKRSTDVRLPDRHGRRHLPGQPVDPRRRPLH